ncbi:MAG: class I SAM-dependent methyltransferase [Chloroflexi bacterium]|nr:class I SAM-dependent methyltransferase [Chloroflexota bacterium]
MRNGECGLRNENAPLLPCSSAPLLLCPPSPMHPHIAQQLVALNRAFYEQFAEPFHQSRREPVAGFYRLLGVLPTRPLTVLDVGCGNGRWGFFLAGYGRVAHYLGLDNSPSYLAKGQATAASHASPTLFHFQLADMHEAGFTAELGQFELIICLSAMQHVPSRAQRAALLAELGRHLAPDGQLVLGNWQLLDSERQRAKVLPWSAVGLSESDVEAGDYLVSWQKGGTGCRYVAHIDEAQTAELATHAQLTITHQFRADGREGNLNLYTILNQSGTQRPVTGGKQLVTSHLQPIT